MRAPARLLLLAMALVLAPACDRPAGVRDEVTSKEALPAEGGAPNLSQDMNLQPGVVVSRAPMPLGAGDAPAPLPSTPTTDPAAAPSMIIRTGQASVEVDSLETGIAQVQALAQRLGGYIANTQMQLGGARYRSASLEVKVPAPRWDELISGISPLGKVEYVNVSAQDVGEEFTDIAARVANARKLEGRLIELLATRTGKLSDVLEIERELARVREEIERMEGRLRYLRAHAATSTLSLTVHERAPVISDGGSGGVIVEAFREAWRNFVRFIGGLIASLGTLIPLGLLIAAGVWVLGRLWRSRRRAS